MLDPEVTLQIKEAMLNTPRPTFFPESKQPQYLLYYPPGTTIFGTETINNGDLAGEILQRIVDGQSVCLPRGDGWKLFQNVNGKFEPCL